MRLSEVCVLTVLVVLASVWDLAEAQGRLRRCFQCRSRGQLGSCKDPFRISNVTELADTRGITAVPCASGWCGKVIEGGQSFATDDYDQATQRMCVQRGPSDSEDRCANTIYNHKKVFMCFCQGDLCNASTRTGAGSTTILAGVLVSAVVGLVFHHRL